MLATHFPGITDRNDENKRMYQFSHIVLRLIIASDYEAMLWKAFVGRHLVLTSKTGLDCSVRTLGKGTVVIIKEIVQADARTIDETET